MQLQTAFSQMKGGAAGGNNQQLSQTIMQMAPEGKVSQEYVDRFVTDVTKILPSANLTPQVHQRLATAVAYVLTPNAQATQVDATLTQIRQALVTAGVQPIAAQTIACDLHLMAAEANPNLVEVRVSP